MNRSSRSLFRRRASPWLAPIRKGFVARSIAGPVYFLLAMACFRADIALAASGAFDGDYRGRFILDSAGSAATCDATNLEQVMSVSGEQVYIERKSLHQNPLLLSGTVAADGSVSASGVSAMQNAQSGFGHTVFSMLSGKIQNGQFTGELSNRGCSWKVTLRK